MTTNTNRPRPTRAEADAATDAMRDRLAEWVMEVAETLNGDGEVTMAESLSSVAQAGRKVARALAYGMREKGTDALLIELTVQIVRQVTDKLIQDLAAVYTSETFRAVAGVDGHRPTCLNLLDPAIRCESAPADGDVFCAPCRVMEDTPGATDHTRAAQAMQPEPDRAHRHGFGPDCYGTDCAAHGVPVTNR